MLQKRNKRRFVAKTARISPDRRVSKSVRFRKRPRKNGINAVSRAKKEKFVSVLLPLARKLLYNMVEDDCP